MDTMKASLAWIEQIDKEENPTVEQLNIRELLLENAEIEIKIKEKLFWSLKSYG